MDYITQLYALKEIREMVIKAQRLERETVTNFISYLYSLLLQTADLVVQNKSGDK